MKIRVPPTPGSGIVDGRAVRAHLTRASVIMERSPGTSSLQTAFKTSSRVGSLARSCRSTTTASGPWVALLNDLFKPQNTFADAVEQNLAGRIAGQLIAHCVNQDVVTPFALDAVGFATQF